MKFPLDNGFLAYNVSGERVPLLFIHGYPLSRRIWDRQVEDLAQYAKVITIDLRGHGDSFPFEAPYSMELLADDCQRLLAYLAIKSPAIVCGLSMGGYITFALYRKYPKLFKGMILTSTKAGADTPEGKSNRDTGVKNALEHGAPFIADEMVTKTVAPVTLATKPALVKNIREIMAGTSVQGITGALQGMKDRPDSTSLLPEIKCPVLIIHGADDQLIPIGEAESMKQKIPNSQLVIIPEAGHLVNMEQPDLFNKSVKDFIQELDHSR